MNKERLFRVIGQVDDHVIERYYQMDERLARKQATRRHTLRALIAAACVVLVFAMSLPLAALSHPAGRAVLQGDSAALTEYLVGIDGFAAWQEKTAEELEQRLPEDMWQLLQTTPILDVLTQSQYPTYAMKGATFGAYLQQPICLTYEVDDSEGRLNGAPQIDVRPTQYQDEAAAPVYTVTVKESMFTLSYSHSLSQSLAHPAVHVYLLHSKQGTYVAYVDAQYGECVYWEAPVYADAKASEPASQEHMIGQAYGMLFERVRDPEAYTLYTETVGDLFICEYTRVFRGDYATEKIKPLTIYTKSCDALVVTFDKAGNVLRYDLGYLGALRYADTEIPSELFSVAYDHVRTYAQSYSGVGTPSRIVITPDGRLAYSSGMNYVLHKDEYAATAKYLAYLTEPASGLEGYELISDGKPAGQRVRLSQNVYTPNSSPLNVRNEFVFDKNGNKITEIAYYDGKEYYRVNYTYDEQGHMTVVEYVSQESEMLNFRYEYEYGENGLPVKQIIMNSKGTQSNEILFEYDEQGREIRRANKNEVVTRTYGENGSYVERTESLHSDSVSECETVYDQNGNLMLERWLNDGGESLEQYEYDEQGRVIRRETLVNGELLAYRTLEYRDGKLYRAINYNASGKITSIEISEYNEYSECILSDYRDAAGNLIQSISYEYGTVKPE
ncbi:MAG: hypothetical protein E7581_07715 [Ruminococcaceae bacterium]|nr:hypothetical protein [Oscillospiraceae bacterium]